MSIREPEMEFRDRLPTEIGAWEREGLISPEQGSAILARYNLRTGRGRVRAFRLGSVATLISVVGAIVLGLGVIIFFAAYWHDLPAWSKTLLVVAATAMAFASGYWVQFRWGALPRVGASLMLLGAILLQAGLFILAQAYGKPVDSPILLLIGTAAVLPLAYAIGSPLLLGFGLLDGLAWMGWTFQQHYPNPPQSFAVPLIYVLVGVLVYAAGHLHTLREDRHHLTPTFAPKVGLGRKVRFAEIYQVLGMLAIFVPTYILTFDSFWDEAGRHHLASVHVPLWFGATTLLAVAGAASLLLARRHDRTARAEAGVFALIALTVGLVAYRPEWAGGYTLLFNVLFLCLALLACARGYLEGEARFVNVGMAFLALGLITRYADTCGPLMPRSVFLMVGGLVLLSVAGGLEWLRRRLLSDMRGPTPLSIGSGA